MIVLTDEQAQFAESLQALLEKKLPVQRTIDAAEDRAADDYADVWESLAASGAASVGSPVEGSLLDLAIGVEAGGAALLPGTLLSHACAIRMTDDERVQSGAVRAAAAADPALGTLALSGGAVSGTLSSVLEAEGADLLAAWTDGGTVVLLETAGLGVAAHPMFDPTRSWADVTVEGARPVAEITSRRAADVLLDAAVLTGFDALGSAQATLDAAVVYAKEREQFHRPIGSFQAVKHLLVDAYATVDAMRSALLYATYAVDDDTEDRAFAVHAAKSLAGGQRTVATTAVQVFGGIGFTREITAHLHVKRSLLDERMFGTPAEHRRAIAQDLVAITEDWSVVPGEERRKERRREVAG